MLALGVVAALVNGLGDPILIVLFSSSLSALADPKEALKEMSEVALIFLYVGGGLMLAAFVQYVCFTKGKRRGEKFWISFSFLQSYRSAIRLTLLLLPLLLLFGKSCEYFGGADEESVVQVPAGSKHRVVRLQQPLWPVSKDKQLHSHL